MTFNSLTYLSGCFYEECRSWTMVIATIHQITYNKNNYGLK